MNETADVGMVHDRLVASYDADVPPASSQDVPRDSNDREHWH
jgi:hypothetical protein